MNDVHTSAVLASLEGQRNTALNLLVKTEAALAVARDKIDNLEKQVAQLTPAPIPEPA